MRVLCRSIAAAFIVLVGALALAIMAMIAPGASVAATSALIMGGTGRPMPSDFPGYIPNVASYYLAPHSSCTPGNGCTGSNLVSVFTPETAWPVYGGLDAPTWKQSIIQGSDLYHQAVLNRLNTTTDEKIVMFGYSQSGAILALEKQKIAAAIADGTITPENAARLEAVIIGNVSRPNGGLNGRLPLTVPIVEFPYGPPTPTEVPGLPDGIKTTDIAMKWDIIADAPLYVTNPLAMLNALLGFEYVHGTYPDPVAASPDSTPGGYTVAEWQDMMDNPELHPDKITIHEYGDTKYLTVTPKVLPLVQPLHSVPVLGKPIADLLEPSLRVIIERTGYDRSINPGVPTPFRLIPIFNPVTLALELVPAVIEGVTRFVADLQELGQPPAPAMLSPLSGKVADEKVVEVAEKKADEKVTVDAPTKKPADLTTDLKTDVKTDAKIDVKVEAKTDVKTDARDDVKVTKDEGVKDDKIAEKTEVKKQRSFPFGLKPHRSKVWSRVGTDPATPGAVVEAPKAPAPGVTETGPKDPVKTTTTTDSQEQKKAAEPASKDAA